MSRLIHPCSLLLVAAVLASTSSCDRSSSGGGVAEPQGTTTPAGQVADKPPAAPQKTEEQPGGAPSVGTLTADRLDVSNLDDASLAAVMQSVQERVAQTAQLAETSSQSRDVKDTSHQIALVQTDSMTTDQSLFQRLNLLPRDSSVSHQIEVDATNSLRTLQGDRRQTFDTDYLDAQRQALSEFIPMFDRMLSVARSPELKVDIARRRTDLEIALQSIAHLQELSTRSRSASR
jgi:hypothetical protein